MAASVIGTTDTGHDIWGGTSAERTALGVKPALTQFQEIGGSLYESNGSVWNVIRIAGAGLVIPKTEIGVVQRSEISDPLSGARTTIFFIGATSVYLAYRDYGSAQGKEARVVFNAFDNADADAKVLNAATRTIVPIGTDLTRGFTSDNLCARMDVYSDSATETGDSKVIYEGVSP